MSRLYLDCETYLIEQEILTPRLVSIQTSLEGEVVIFTRDRFDEAFNLITSVLQGGGQIIGHNIPYDLACLCVERDSLLDLVFEAYTRGQIHCTMIREQLIGIALGEFRRWRYSLSAIAERRLGVVLSGKSGGDIWRLRYCELEGLPLGQWPDAAVRYAADDVRYTALVFEHQETDPRITDTGRRAADFSDETEQACAAFALHLISVYGMAVDTTAASVWIEKIEKRAKEQLEKARAGGFLREDGTKDISKLRALVREGYDGAPPLTEKGAVKTDRDTLLGSALPVLVSYAEGSKVQKLASTYTKILKGVGSVHPRYNCLRRSGRTSCEKPNLQQSPRDGEGFRDCFIPREGMVLVLADYAQIELLSLGQILLWWFGTSSLVDAVKAGRDLHVEVAATLEGVDYATMLGRVEAGDREAKELRQFSKVGNYGFAGGLSSNSFADYARGYGLDLDPQRAGEIRRAWLDTWPEMRSYFDRLGQATRSGSLITITQAVSKRQRGGCSWTQAANGYFQSLVADGAKQALWEVSRACYTDRQSPLWGSRPVAFLHDEIILESPTETSREAAGELSRVMIEVMERYLPDVPVSAESLLASRWSKNAQRVMGPEGLEVWG